MSTLSDLLDALSKKNITDYEVDKIVSAAEKVAGALTGNPDVSRDLEELKVRAASIKSNRDFSSIEDITELKDLNTAVNIYYARVEKNGKNEYFETEALLADKLADLSEKADGQEVFRIANNMVRRSTSILDNGTPEQKKAFAGCLCTAYNFSSSNVSYTSSQSSRVLDNVKELAPYGAYPEAAFACLRLNFDDEKVAGKFLKYTDEILSKMDDGGKDTLLGDELINAYAQIVSRHPQLAKQCGFLVNRVADMQGNKHFLTDTYEKAAEYYGNVAEMDNVDEEAKSYARIKRTRWQKQFEKASQRTKLNPHQVVASQYQNE